MLFLLLLLLLSAGIVYVSILSVLFCLSVLFVLFCFICLVACAVAVGSFLDQGGSWSETGTARERAEFRSCPASFLKLSVYVFILSVLFCLSVLLVLLCFFLLGFFSGLDLSVALIFQWPWSFNGFGLCFFFLAFQWRLRLSLALIFQSA